MTWSTLYTNGLQNLVFLYLLRIKNKALQKNVKDIKDMYGTRGVVL